MTTSVFPAARRAIDLCILSSFSGSVNAVASSRRTIGASLRIALAIDMRWRSPPERAPPASPAGVSIPCGSRFTNSSQQAALAAAATSSSVACGRPSRMFSRIVASKR